MDQRSPSFFDSTTKIVGGLTGLLGSVAALVAALAQFGLLPTSGDSANQAAVAVPAAAQRAALTSRTTAEQSTTAQTGEQTARSQPTPKRVLRVPVSGTYSGTGAERGSANKDIKVVMTFSSAGSSVSYPSLDCFGRLIPQGFEGGRRIYLERITAGHCDQGGLWHVKVSGEKRLEALWTLASADYTVTVVLHR